MPIMPYLALTVEEFRRAVVPAKCGWMACHFSPYSTGLTNLPQSLPGNALLILNDRTPIHGHDPERVGAQLEQAVRRLRCRAVLLDMQRTGSEETAALVRHLAGALPCPVVISEGYAVNGHPVFLPPVPCDVPVKDYLAPWKGQEIWLEAALDGTTLHLTEAGCTCLPLEQTAEKAFEDKALHIHYAIEENADSVDFHLHRTADDLHALLEEAEALGVKESVGLYQELGKLHSI